MKNKITIFALMFTVIASLFTVVGCTITDELKTMNNVATTTNYNYELPDDWWEKTWYDTGMYMANTLQYSSSNYDLESILRISNDYTVWIDKDRVDGSEYDIKFTFDDNMLNGGIYQNGNYLSSGVKSAVDEDLNDTIGDYIYIQFIGMNWGTILLDSNKTYTKSVTEIYEYVMNRDLDIRYLHPFEVSDAPLVEGYNELIETYYSHVNNFSAPLKTYVTVVDFNELEQTCNPEITYQQTICPDDDKEDAESEYNIQYFDTVYVPASLFGPSFMTVLSDVVLLKNGEFCDEDITVTSSYPSIDNTNDYSLTMNVKLPDGVWYKKTINVEIIDSNYSMGYVILEDGTLVTVKHYSDSYTNEEIKNGIDEFIDDLLGYSGNDITIDGDVNSTKVYNGTFNRGPLKIINSGYGSLKYSSPNTPVDDSAAKQGFNVISDIYYTSNFTVEDVVQALGDNLLLFNGSKPTEDYKVIADINQNRLNVEIHIGDDVVTWYNIDLIEVTDSNIGNYIVGTHHGFVQPIIYIEPKTSYDISSEMIIQEILDKHYWSITLYETQFDADLGFVGQHELNGLYTNGAGNYFNLTGVFEVIDINQKVENTNVEWYTEPEQELEQTDYSIKEIDTIYLHSYVSLDGLLDLVKEELLLKDGVYCTYDYTISARMFNDIDYGDEFEIEIYVRFPDDVTRTFMVNVVRLNSNSLKMGVIKLETGDLLVGTSSRNQYTTSQMQQGLDNFVKQYLGFSVSDVILRNNYDDYVVSQIYNNNSYNEGNNYILIGVTGSTGILNTSKDDPVDDDAQKEGYDLYHTIYYTSNYKLEDVLNVVGKYILLNNGIPVKADYKVYIEFYDTDMITVEITYNGNILITDVIRLKVVDNSPIGNYIYGETSGYNNGLLILEGSTDPQYEFNDIFNYLIKTYHAAWEDLELEEEILLTEEGIYTLREVIYNGTYWNYYLDVKITDFNNELDDSNVDFEDEFIFPGYPDNPNPSDPSTDTEDETQANTITQILIITLSTVVGVLIIVIAVKGCKKIAHWLK